MECFAKSITETEPVTYMLFLRIPIIMLLIFSSGCDRQQLQRCETAMTHGRIIGYNPCRQYIEWGKVEGAGFVVEIDNGTTKDTTVTFGIPENLFQFHPEYIDGSYSSFVFRPEIQEKLKVNVSFRYAGNNEKTLIFCNGMINTADYDSAVKGKEILVTCISAR